MGLGGEVALLLVVGFAVAGLLLALIIRRTEDFLNAAVLFSLAWAPNLLACVVLAHEGLRLELTTLLVVIGAWWLFLLGFLAGCWFRWPLLRGTAAVSGARGRLLLVALIALQVVAVSLEIRQIGVLGDAASLTEQLARLAELRNAGAFTSVAIPSVWSVWRWDFALYLPLAFVLCRDKALRLRWVILVAVVALAGALLQFTRAPLLNVLAICIVGSWVLRASGDRLWRGARRRLAAVALALAGFAVLFGVMEEARIGQPRGLGGRLGGYVGEPMRAYQDVLQHGDWWKSDRVYTLDFLDYLAFKLGLDARYDGTVRPYIDVGEGTNVYTYLDAFTIDAGVPGALAGSLALGAGVGWLFALARRKGSYWSVVMYSYAAYNCLMAGANNQFVQLSFLLTAGLALLFGVVISAQPLAALRLVGEGPPREP
jgi:oligosaccharide repeat unit polymerase